MTSLENIIKISRSHYWMKNASPSDDDEGSMIEYWEQAIGQSLERRMFCCPKCGKMYSRNMLDGAHVVKLISRNRQQFITPLCQSCNRSKDDSPFWVPKQNVVPAP